MKNETYESTTEWFDLEFKDASGKWVSSRSGPRSYRTIDHETFEPIIETGRDDKFWLNYFKVTSPSSFDPSKYRVRYYKKTQRTTIECEEIGLFSAEDIMIQ